MIKQKTASALNMLFYPVIYKEKPWEGVEWVMKKVVHHEEPFSRSELLEVIDEALTQSGWVGQVASIYDHTEEDAKKFLSVLREAVVKSDRFKNIQEPSKGRVESGQPCSQSGYWFTPAANNSRRYFKQGDVMPEFKSDYGATIWQWAEDQSDPKL